MKLVQQIVGLVQGGETIDFIPLGASGDIVDVEWDREVAIITWVVSS